MSCLYSLEIKPLLVTSFTNIFSHSFELSVLFVYGSFWTSLVVQLVKNPPAMQENWVWSLGWGDPLKKGKPTYASIMAWRIPWTVVRGVSQNRTQLNNFHFHWDSLVQIVKSLQCGRPGFNPWVGKIPWRRNWQPTPVLLPRKSHEGRSLEGCSPWGRWVRHDWVTFLSLFTFMHWRRQWQPTRVFLPRESQGQGSPVGCGLWGRTVGDDWSNLAAAAAGCVWSHVNYSSFKVECLLSHQDQCFFSFWC